MRERRQVVCCRFGVHEAPHYKAGAETSMLQRGLWIVKGKHMTSLVPLAMLGLLDARKLLL